MTHPVIAVLVTDDSCDVSGGAGATGFITDASGVGFVAGNGGVATIRSEFNCLPDVVTLPGLRRTDLNSIINERLFVFISRSI